jgi:hypothetical protein
VGKSACGCICVNNWKSKCLHSEYKNMWQTHTSTSTGYAASRSSSRQLGGRNICTAARVPCVREISNDLCIGSASSWSLSKYWVRVSYNILTSLCVFAKCTPVRGRKKNWNRSRRQRNFLCMISLSSSITYNAHIYTRTHTLIHILFSFDFTPSHTFSHSLLSR